MPRLSPGRASCEREDAGVTHTIERTHSDAPRAPVIMPAGSMPRPPGSGVTKPARRNRTRPISRLSPVTSLHGRDDERWLQWVGWSLIPLWAQAAAPLLQRLRTDNLKVATLNNLTSRDLYGLFQRVLNISTVPTSVWPEVVVRNILATDKAHFSHSRNQIIYGSRFWFNLDDLLGECLSLHWKAVAKRNIVSYAFAKADSTTEIDCYFATLGFFF